MRNRMIALLAGLMVLGIAGTALAAPSVDRILDLELDYAEAEFQYRLYSSDLTTPPDFPDAIEFPEDFILNHGQMLNLIKNQVRENWEGGLGCLVRELAKSELGKEDLNTETVYSYNLPLACAKKAEGELSPGQLKKQIRDGAPGKPDWAKGPKG